MLGRVRNISREPPSFFGFPVSLKRTPKLFKTIQGRFPTDKWLNYTTFPGHRATTVSIAKTRGKRRESAMRKTKAGKSFNSGREERIQF